MTVVEEAPPDFFNVPALLICVVVLLYTRIEPTVGLRSSVAPAWLISVPPSNSKLLEPVQVMVPALVRVPPR